MWCLKVGDTFYKARRVIHKKFKTLPLLQITKHETTTIIIYSFICDVLRNLVPLAQFKKREKHPWRSATFISLLKVTLLRGCFPRFLNFKIVPNRAMDYIYYLPVLLVISIALLFAYFSHIHFDLLVFRL